MYTIIKESGHTNDGVVNADATAHKTAPETTRNANLLSPQHTTPHSSPYTRTVFDDDCRRIRLFSFTDQTRHRILP